MRYYRALFDRTTPQQIFRRRLIAVLIVAVTLGCVLAGRLFILQIRHAEYFSERASRMCVRTHILAAPRAAIVDCNGELFAANVPRYDVYWNGSGIHATSNTREVIVRIARELKSIDNREIAPVNELRILRAEAAGRRICIARNIAHDRLARLCELTQGCLQYEIVVNCARVYPQGTCAAHLIGYLGGAQGSSARSGIEKWCDAALCGTVGLMEYVTAAAGRRVHSCIVQPSIEGKTLHLTIDAQLQRTAEALFTQGQAGALVVFDPHNGAIKALVSYPSFDPHWFAGPISEKTWSDIMNGNAPLMNRALHATYPPASLFKLVTFSAGLEAGVISCDATTCCDGYMSFGGRRFYCIRRWGHGNVHYRKALAVSCNIPCYEIARKLTVDMLAEYAMRFGLGSAAGCILADASGLIPTSGWKRSAKGENWWPGETLSASIGQSYMLVTPLQIARMIGAIASGYLMHPRILRDEPVEQVPLAISPSTRQFLCDGMRDSALWGTARALRGIPECMVYAKTGTAQLESLKDTCTYAPEHGWLGCFFSAHGAPPLVLVVLVERAGSARPAIAIAREFISWYVTHATPL